MGEVVNTLSTKIRLDIDDSNLYDLRQELKYTNAEWKNTIDTSKLAGNSYEAATAKVNKEQDALKLLKQQLELQRSELEKVTGSSKADESVRQDWEKQIRNTNVQIEKHTNLLEKAENYENLYKNGVLQSKQALQESEQVYSSRAEKLRAEGREIESNKTKYEGNQRALEHLMSIEKGQQAVLDTDKEKLKNLTGQYNDQIQILQKMESEGKKNTSEYKEQQEVVESLSNKVRKSTSMFNRQETQLNQTGSSIAKLKTENNGLRNDIDKVSSNPFLRLRAAVHETNDEASHSSSIFKEVFKANLATNLVSAGWQQITMHIGGAVKAGMEYDEEQQKMVATWTTLTGHHKDAEIMVDDVNKLSVATGQSAQQTDELEQKFYHLHSSKDEAHDMTKAMLDMADAVGLNGQQIDAVSQDMTNALSRGKASAGEINQITQYFPMYREELAKSKNVTVQQLNEMVKQGKISADDMEKVFEHLGNVKYSKAADNMLETMKGAERVIKARVPALIGAIENPIMNAKSPILLAASKWASDPATEKEFDKVGNAAKKGIETVSNAFSKSFSTKGFEKNMDGLVEKIASGITKLSKTIAAHSKDIEQFMKNFKAGSVNSIKLFALVMEDLAKVTIPFLSFMAKNANVFAPLIASLIVMNKLGRLVIGIKAAASALKLWTGATKVMTGAQILFNAVMSANPINLLIIAISSAALAFTIAYKKIKPFHDAVNKLGKMIVNVFKGVIDFFKNNWKEVGLIILAPFVGIPVALYKNVKPFRDFVNTVRDVIVKGFNSIGSFFGGFWNGVKNSFNVYLGFLTKIWSSEWNGISNIGKAIWNGITSFLGGFWNGIKSIFNSSLNWIANIWNKGWNGIFSFGKGIWNGITGTLGDWWDGLKSMFKSAGSSISDIWSNTWNGVAKTFSNIWDGIKKTAHDGVKGIISVLNSGISGIDDVIGMFGGNKNSLKPIKFANGTGALDQHTYSMLNDGNDSPETGNKELAILPNGKAFMPKERNWTGLLPKGTAVLNATETKLLMQMQNIHHFADGGIVGGIESMFSVAVDTVKNVGGSIWGSIKGFGSDLKKGFDMATSIASDPGKYIKDLIKAPNVKGDVMQNLGLGMFDKAKDSAVDFWDTTWKEVSSILESGGGSGSMGEFLQYAIKNFTGREYVYGGFDCSEMVKEALEHFGIKGVGRTTVAQEHSGKLQSLGGDIHKTKPGDLVYFGTSGADAHVGIVSDVNRGLMMNQHPQRGGVSSIAAAAAIDGAPRYYHVKGLSSDDSSDKKSKGNSGLTKFVHNMFDNSMFKWIQEKLAPFGEDVDSGGVPGEAPKGDHKNWMRQAGIPESWFNGINEIVTKESSWKTNARNGKYYGLAQTSSDVYRKYGSDWKTNPITQLKAMHGYIKERYGTIQNALSFRHAHNWYANGGLVDSEQLAHIAENNRPEMIIPMSPERRPRAMQLASEVVSQFAKDDPGLVKEKQEGFASSALLQEVRDLKEIVKNIVKLQIQTIQSQDVTTTAVREAAFDKNNLYKTQALNQRITDAQAF